MKSHFNSIVPRSRLVVNDEAASVSLGPRYPEIDQCSLYSRSWSAEPQQRCRHDLSGKGEQAKPSEQQSPTIRRFVAFRLQRRLQLLNRTDGNHRL
jgi:hypothetical protein